MVGGYAAQIHGSTRVTTDVDVTPERSAAQVVVDGLELVSEIGLPHPAPVTRIRDRAARFPTAVASGLRGVGSSRRPQRAQTRIREYWLFEAVFLTGWEFWCFSG